MYAISRSTFQINESRWTLFWDFIPTDGRGIHHWEHLGYSDQYRLKHGTRCYSSRRRNIYTIANLNNLNLYEEVSESREYITKTTVGD